MPRTLWRLRRAPDSPRPAGRRWTGGLRRSRVFARRVLRVRRRRAGTLTPDPYHPIRPPHRTRPEQIETPDRASEPAPPRLLPGERTAARRVRFLVVNLCTLASLSLGITAILLAMRGETRIAALCLIACVACDGLDGMLARRLRVATPFGTQMDSLADMCAFGVAAPLVLYASLAGTVPPAAAAVACAMVASCAAIRLARFNVTPRGERFCTGVPTTAVAAVLALAVLIELPLPAAVQLVGLALLAFAMVSSFPYATLARLVRLPVWLWLAPVAGALVNAQLTFLVLVTGYLASGPVLWLHQRRTASSAEEGDPLTRMA